MSEVVQDRVLATFRLRCKTCKHQWKHVHRAMSQYDYLSCPACASVDIALDS